MTYKAYIDNIKAKTGKGPEYYLEEAEKKGLEKHGELLAWLKSDCGLGHGHANAMILYIKNPTLAKRKITRRCKEGKSEEIAEHSLPPVVVLAGRTGLETSLQTESRWLGRLWR